MKRILIFFCVCFIFMSNQLINSDDNIYDINVDIFSIKKQFGGIYFKSNNIKKRFDKEEMEKRFGENYKYSEMSVFNVIPNTVEGDILKIYDYQGLEYYFFCSEENNKNFLYYWEINDNYYLSDFSIHLGMKRSIIEAKYGKGNCSVEKAILYSFEDGRVSFGFDEESKLIDIVWMSEDDM